MANSRLKGNEQVNIPTNGENSIFAQGEANFLAFTDMVLATNENGRKAHTTLKFKLLFKGAIVGDGIIKVGDTFQLSNTVFDQIILIGRGTKPQVATISYGLGTFNDTSSEFVNIELPEIKNLLDQINVHEHNNNALLSLIQTHTLETKQNTDPHIIRLGQPAIKMSDLLNDIKDNTQFNNVSIAQYLTYIYANTNNLSKINSKMVSDFPYKSETKSVVAVNEYLTFDLNETDLIKIDVGMNNVANSQFIKYEMEFSNGNQNDDFFKLGSLHTYNEDVRQGTEPINQTFNTTNWTTLKIKILYKTGSLVSRMYVNVNSFKK